MPGTPSLTPSQNSRLVLALPTQRHGEKWPSQESSCTSSCPQSCQPLASLPAPHSPSSFLSSCGLPQPFHTHPWHHQPCFTSAYPQTYKLVHPTRASSSPAHSRCTCYHLSGSTETPADLHTLSPVCSHKGKWETRTEQKNFAVSTH